jgi:histidyl-tRNA synthetase
MFLLASEEEDEKILASQAPSIIKFLKKDSKAHYIKFKEYLDILKVPYVEDHTLIAKNEYNTNSTWEFRTKYDEMISK